MEPRLTRLLSSFGKAHSQLTRALAQPKDEFVRDAAIQRFEFTFELFWKTLQAYCQTHGSLKLRAVLNIVIRSQLDFVQLRSIAERFSEALQQCAWDFNQIGLLLGR
jgi:hypothetical protein